MSPRFPSTAPINRETVRGERLDRAEFAQKPVATAAPARSSPGSKDRAVRKMELDRDIVRHSNWCARTKKWGILGFLFTKSLILGTYGKGLRSSP
jgi:hypothetical protein